MIYGAFPPASVPKNSTYTTYNARRDNLGSRFWSESYLQHHGLIVIEAFYEWVGVADLIRGGEVSLEDVEKTFEKQSLERKKKVLESNKKYRPTPTELKDPRERKIIIQFAPQDKQLMHVPVIFSVNHENAKEFGFAIITDDPPQDVSSAGHDRCPIVLSREGALDWFTAKMKKSSDYLKILGDIRVPKLIHKIA
jgi:putative SOS response-associated peptidase YedK